MASILLSDHNLNMEYATFELREASFAPPVKRSKVGGWPHSAPTATDLAKAGFYFRPSAHSNDNTVCFLCSRNLDGWEKDDDPIEEHLKHAEDCGWALLMSISAADQYDIPNIQDPTGQQLTEARRSTFAIGWPHESKRGWTCKSEKMVEGGWHFAPTAECEDYVSCVYCKLSLDGWEPKDNPFEEHYTRSPSCPFFAFAGTSAPSKRTKAKRGRASRSSRTSKASARLSTQSNVSTQSEAPTIPDLDESIDGSADTSLVSVASAASTATVKGKRRGTTGRTKGTKTKRARTTKTTKKVEPEPEIQTEPVPEIQIPESADDLPGTAQILYPQIRAGDSQEDQLVTDSQEPDDVGTARLTSPTAVTGPPDVQESPIPVMNNSPVPKPNSSQKVRSPSLLPLRRLSRAVTPELPDSPSKQSDIENAPPSTRPKSVRPPLSSPGTVLPEWTAVDIEMVFQAAQSTQLPQALADGDLSKIEQQMTVQDWVKHMATKAEDDLRAEGERVVGIFEQEGRRALTVLEAITCG